MQSLATTFCAILATFRVAVTAHTGRDPKRTPIFILLAARLGRMARRFESLFSKWQAGKLPKPRKPRPARPATMRERARLPTRRAWLLYEPEIFRLAAALARHQLEHLFTDPAFETFVKSVPQAGRILRPLCHMLGSDTPFPLPTPSSRVERAAVPPSRPRASKPPKFNIPLKRPRLPPVMFPARRPSPA